MLMVEEELNTMQTKKDLPILNFEQERMAPQKQVPFQKIEVNKLQNKVPG